MKKTLLFLCALFVLSITIVTAQKSFVVEKTGQGQPILLFPGFTCTHEVYDDLIEVLAENYELHAFTFAGFGEVEPTTFTWLPQIKSGIETYIKEYDLINPIIIGHSMGGTLGLWLASESDTYDKLIVIDALSAMGALMMPDYDSEAIVYDNPHNNQILAMDEESFKNMAHQTATFMAINTEKHQQIAEWMIASDRETYVYGYTDLLKLDLRDALADIKNPVHILGATHPYGKKAAEANYRTQYQNLKDYSLTFAEGAAHFIMYDQPKWFIDQINIALNINE